MEKKRDVERTVEELKANFCEELGAACDEILEKITKIEKESDKLFGLTMGLKGKYRKIQASVDKVIKELEEGLETLKES